MDGDFCYCDGPYHYQDCPTVSTNGQEYQHCYCDGPYHYQHCPTVLRNEQEHQQCYCNGPYHYPDCLAFSRNWQECQHGSNDNSINEKLDTLIELMIDIQKANEMKDKEIKALSQQVTQLTEEVAIIRRDQDKPGRYTQICPAHNSSNTTSVSINEVSTRPFSEISVVETYSSQCVEVGVNDITESQCEGEHDQEIKSFANSENNSNSKFAESSNLSVKVPFPLALLASKNLSKREPPRGERWESFKKVKLNKPLLEQIKQNPDHVECLEELSTHKRRHKFPKQLDLTASVNAVLMGTLPPKLQDPGTPFISIQIGDIKLDRALLDLGACVSVLPGSLYDQHEFGPLKKVKTIVVLADQTPTCPRGIVEDVIVKVGEFYYPVDFLVLDCLKNTQPTVILGRPFLATTKAVIDCDEGTVRMRFGERKMSLKVFSNSSNRKTNKCGSPEKENQTEKKECFMIDRLNEEKVKKKSRRRRRKKAKKLLEYDHYRETCKFYDLVWENTNDENGTSFGGKNPTRPP